MVYEGLMGHASIWTAFPNLDKSASLKHVEPFVKAALATLRTEVAKSKIPNQSQ